MIRETGIEIRPGDVVEFARAVANWRDSEAANGERCEPGPVRAEYEDHAQAAGRFLGRAADCPPGDPLELVAEDPAERMALVVGTDRMLRRALEGVAGCDVDDYGAIDASLDAARYWNDLARELNYRLDLAEAADYETETI